jgi:hypothetical protein
LLHIGPPLFVQAERHRIKPRHELYQLQDYGRVDFFAEAELAAFGFGFVAAGSCHEEGSLLVEELGEVGGGVVVLV